MADAVVTVNGDATGVQRAMAVGASAVRNFANEAKSAVGSATATIITGLADVALAQGKVSFASQHQQVRDFELSSARMANAVGRDWSSVRSEAEATGLAIGKRPGEVIAWSDEVGKLTYNFSGAMAGMKGMAELGALTGRTAQDYRGLAVELANVGHVSGDTSKMVELLHVQADNLGVVGGVAAFADQIEALSDTFSHFAVSAPEDFGRLTELAGKLGAGLNPAAAGRVQQSVMGSLSSNTFEWSRYLGRDIYDKETGQLEDPNKTLGDIVQKMSRSYKGDSLRRALVMQFGVEAGSRVYGLHKSGQLYKSMSAKPAGAGAAPHVTGEEALGRFLGGDAGKREVAQAQLAVASDKLLGSSSALGQAADALQQFASSHPVASTFAATAAGMTLSGFMSSFGGSVAKMMGGKGEGGAAGGAVELLTKGKGAPIGAIAKAAPLIGMGLAADTAVEEKLNEQQIGLGLTFGDIRGGGYGGVDKASTEKTGKAAFAKFYAAKIAEMTHANAAAGGAHGGGAGGPLIISAPGGQQPALDTAALQKAVADGIADGMGRVSINMQSNPDNPLTATLATSQSSSAGNQSGT